MHLRHFVHGLPQSPCSLYIGKTRRRICIRTVEHLNPKSNSAINKHKNDTNIIHLLYYYGINENKPAIRNITEMLLIKQHNPTLNNIINLITYTTVPCVYSPHLYIVRTILKM